MRVWDIPYEQEKFTHQHDTLLVERADISIGFIPENFRLTGWLDGNRTFKLLRVEETPERRTSAWVYVENNPVAMPHIIYVMNDHASLSA